MMNDPRYVPVAAALPAVLPPLTRIEAERAARRLTARFCVRDDGRTRSVPKVRRCWISTKPTSGHLKGWGRLIHDLSHYAFRWRYPHKRPHDSLHSRYERDLAAYVAGTDWLAGGLAPKVKPAPTADEKRAAKLASVERRLKAWRTKAKRAATAIKKLERQQRRLANAEGRA